MYTIAMSEFMQHSEIRIKERQELSPEMERLFTTCKEKVATAQHALEQMTTELYNTESLTIKIEQNLNSHLENIRHAAETISNTGSAVWYKESQFISIDKEGCEKELLDFDKTITTFNALEKTPEAFKKEGIALLDRYFADTKNIERLAAENIQTETIAITGSIPPDFDVTAINASEDISLLPWETELAKDLEPNKTYIVRLPEDTNQPGIMDKLNYIKNKVEKLENQPNIIVYSEKKVPDDFRIYRDFLFANGKNELEATLYTVKDINLTRRQKPEFMEASILSESQENLYNNSDLREWEQKTADTKQSLSHILEAMKRISIHTEFFPPLKSNTILDLGTGEGRISTQLAILGNKVIGMDISEQQLRRVKTNGGRLTEEINQYINDKKNGTSNSPLSELLQTKEITTENIHTNYKDASDRLQVIKGDFTHLEENLHTGLSKLKRDGLDIADYFDLDSEYKDVLIQEDQTFFPEAWFNMVTMSWHTFCEAGDIEGQKNVLKQIFNVVTAGGILYLEVPDRTVGNYAISLAKYHTDHPNEPYGTIRDETSTKEGEANRTGQGKDTPRFFPGRDELRNLLKAVGFIDITIDTYLITSKDREGKEYLEVKELVFIAKKLAPF